MIIVVIMFSDEHLISTVRFVLENPIRKPHFLIHYNNQLHFLGFGFFLTKY